MTIIYRTAGAWGGGVLFDLPAATIDANFWDLHGRVTVIEAWPMPAGIDYFEIEGNELTVVMDDYTTRGPYTLPTYVPSAFVWEPDLSVVPGMMFSENSTIYTVIFPHITVDPFDPAENDGLGNNYYQEFITIDGSLPAGGAAGQQLLKSTSTDYDVTWGSVYPSGGAVGTYLGKLSSTNDDVAWITIVAPPTSRDTISASTLTLGNGNMGQYIRFTNATSCTVTIPTNAADTLLILNAEITLHQAGAGYVEIVADGGVTLNVPDGFIARLYGLHATATLKKVQTNEWDLMGLLQPA